MAVYTKIDNKSLESFLENYNIGHLIKCEGIQEGIENSNYKLITSTGTYILTIFEKRVEKKDLPFFIELQKYLVQKNFMCPKPIINQKNSYINNIKNKPCVINTFLNGKKIDSITVDHCQQLGKHLAMMHIATYNFKFFRQNNLSQKYWKNLFDDFKYNKNTKYKNLFEDINLELVFLEKKWPDNLTLGVIHADLFQDNVFFKNEIISGIIDFYFACNDFYAYELAICVNAWCFNNKFILDTEKYLALLNAYQDVRKLSKAEISAMPILLRGAAIRFLLTRLNDCIYPQKQAYVQQKNPIEYFNILKFHQNNNNLIKPSL